MTADVLFRPFAIRGLSLANRIVMAPMTRSFSPDGFPTPEVAAYYARRAAADVGLIISEGTGVDRPAALNDPHVPRFHGERELEGWKAVIDAVHAAGGRMAPQLWHVGSARNPAIAWTPSGPTDSPSGLSSPGRRFGDPMSDEDIADAVAAFGRAAADARRLGFDCVEIHGAHGYLIDQFFWDGTNDRHDRFGGASIQERARFAAEVVAQVRADVGPDFAIILRLSQWKQQDYRARLARTPDQLSQWLTPLVEAGADVLHCSQRRFWEPEFPELDGEAGLNLAGWAKKVTGAATISVGSVGLSGDFFGAFAGEGARAADLNTLIERMERDEFDMIAVGRALLQDPKWARKIRQGLTDDLMSFDAAALGSLS